MAGDLAEEVKRLKEEVRFHEDEARGKQEKIKRIQANCRHQWPEPIYTPEHIEAYTIPGDPPGTMGVDWRGPVRVPAKTIPKWTRTCPLCDKTEETDKTTEKIIKLPSFSG